MASETRDGGPDWTQGVHFHFRKRDDGKQGFIIDQCMDRGDGVFEVGASFPIDLATAIRYAADMTGLLGIGLRLYGGELPAVVWQQGYDDGWNDQQSVHYDRGMPLTLNPYKKAT